MKNKKNNYKTIIIAVIATFLLTAFTVAQLTSLKVNAGDTLTAEQWNLLVDAVENAAKDLPEPTANTDAATKSYVDAAGSGVVYTHWGSASCGTGTKIYSGVVVYGAHMGSQGISITNVICSEDVFVRTGTSLELLSRWFKGNGNKYMNEVPCAVCLTS